MFFFLQCLLSPCSMMTKCMNKSPGYACEPCPEGYTGNVPSGIGLAHAARTKQVRKTFQYEYEVVIKQRK